MRGLVHPAAADIKIEAILYALSDPVRFALFAEIAGSGCSQSCAMAAKASVRAIPKSTLSQHFRILRESGLIRGERLGVEMRTSSRCAEVEARFPGVIAAIVNAYTRQATDLAHRSQALHG